ncbi:uncharacterized protein [Amphiura filiformis]|uniref:uncharacterized protein n=1 Tax=Amphiura filiformis TaxID=82378 RepID=UPI003B217E15
MFKQKKDSRQWTWESPDQKTHNKIDYIIISNRWKTSVTNARSFPSADVGSDHQLVITNIRLKFHAKKKPNYPKQYDIFRLKSPEHRKNYEVEIGGRFAPLLEQPDTNTETTWEGIKTAFNETSKKVLGFKKGHKEKPWISEEVIQLTNERSRAKQERIKDPTKRGRYNFLSREIKRKVKGCRDQWLKDLCKKVDNAHQAAKSKEVYSTIKKITRFRPGRSTIDQLFTLRQIVEKHLEMRKALFCCYIDFEKAFDSVWQEGLWKALGFFGFPNKITCLLKALYNKSASTVRVNGELTDWFTTLVGVRQGCVISPQLFNILLEMTMLYALHDSNIGVNIQGQVVNNLRFADDIALIANSEEDLQTL